MELKQLDEENMALASDPDEESNARYLVYTIFQMLGGIWSFLWLVYISDMTLGWGGRDTHK